MRDNKFLANLPTQYKGTDCLILFELPVKRLFGARLDILLLMRRTSPNI
jgi:hypothetical protein